MDESTVLTVPKRKVRSKMMSHNFAPCIKVVLPDKSFVMVPIDKVSSDAKRQLLVAKARDFVEQHLDRLMNAGLTPAEIRDLVKAVEGVDALQREQYISSLNNSLEGAAKGVGAMVREAAKGAAEGTSQGFMAKLDAMKKAAQKADENAKAIDV